MAETYTPRPDRDQRFGTRGNLAGVMSILTALLVPSAVAQPLTFTRLAGTAGSQGAVDGSGTAARFQGPSGVAVDGSGSIYVADTGNHTIRKVTPGGIVTTVAGLAGSPGSADGNSRDARFNGPRGVAVDGSGNVYVADTGNHTIRKVTASGEVVTLAGAVGFPGSSEGSGFGAQFNGPRGVAVDVSGNVYVADTNNHTIRKVSSAGLVTTWVGRPGIPGSTDSASGLPTFDGPSAVAVDGTGNVFVADTNNHTIRKVTPAAIVTTFTGRVDQPGTTNGSPGVAQFNRPAGVAVDGSSNVWVADSASNTIRMVTSTGFVSTPAGFPNMAGSNDGTGMAAQFRTPTGVAVYGAGNVHVADQENHAIRRVTPAGAVTTLAGLGAAAGVADGTGTAARFNGPTGIALDGSGNAYAADRANHTIRKVASGGVVSTLAGQPGFPGSSEGTGAGARFNNPAGVAVDLAGDLYVADTGNHTIRKVTSGGEVSTLAGVAGSSGSADGAPFAARFNSPSGVAVDGNSIVYVADQYNHTIRKTNLSNDVSTLAGLAGNSGSADGTGAEARFAYPAGVAVDGAGNVYVADRDNHTIRKVTSEGVVTTLAGLAGTPGTADGNGNTARFNYPSGVAVDGTGNVYVADQFSHTIRMVTPSGDVTTVGGLPGVPGGADGTGSMAQFNFPAGLAVGTGGRLLVADRDNHAIRQGVPGLADAATIDQPTSPVGVERQLGTSPGTANSWLWEQIRKPSGSTATLSSTSVRGPTFTPDVPELFVFRLTASNGVATSVTTVNLTAWVPPTATVSGGGSICPGESISVQAALTGTPPWSLTWSDGVTQSGLTFSPAERLVSPATVMTYHATAVSDAYGSGTWSGAASVVLRPTYSASITGPARTLPGQSGLTASVPDGGAGNTYAWTIANGTIDGPATDRQVLFTAGNQRFCVLDVTVTGSSGCSTTGSWSVWVGADPVPPLTFTHLAGTVGGPGWFDGTGTAARFAYPLGAAVDSSGNVYVADTENHTIRKVTPAGAVTTLAGMEAAPGSDDETGSLARFRSPSGVAVDGLGNLYVADTGNHTIRKVSPGGTVTTLAGLASSPGSSNGTGSAARFRYPAGVAVDADGIVYVADQYNHTIRKVSSGGTVTTLAGLALNYGSSDGTGALARFQWPSGVSVDGSGNVYVADQYNHTVRLVTPAGVVTTLAGLAGSSGSLDGTGAAARFALPAGVAVDGSGNVLVADRNNHAIRVVSSGGAVTTLAGFMQNSGSHDDTGVLARFTTPAGVAVDQDGNAYVADSGNNTLRKVTTAGVVTTLAGLAGESDSLDGTGAAAAFRSPNGVAVDGSGNVYVADQDDQTIRKVTAAGSATTFAGKSRFSGSADGTGDVARFLYPAAVAVDRSGNVYVADQGNHTIRKVTPAREVTTLAGAAGSSGSADGIGTNARFATPKGVAVDGPGNVYVADFLNRTIRKVTPSGEVSTLAGLAGASGSDDGTGSAARFRRPVGVAADAAGNVYVADRDACTIRKVTPAGVVSTLAGLADGQGSTDGTGSAARFYYPTGVSVDGDGNVYVADQSNQVIRKVTPGGVVTTLAGRPESPGSADGTASEARFNDPAGVAVGFGGDLYVADRTNHAVRKGTARLLDAATIDQANGRAGEPRQLGTSPTTAATWLWELVGIPTGSTAGLSATNISSPSFTPDVPGYYVFRLTATAANGLVGITTVALSVCRNPDVTIAAPSSACASSTGHSASVPDAGAGASYAWSATNGSIVGSTTGRTVSFSVGPSGTATVGVTVTTGACSAYGSTHVTVQQPPSTPVIAAPATATVGAAGLVASVPAVSGAAYEWTITNGTITGGEGTREITFTAGPLVGPLTLEAIVQDALGCRSSQGSASVTVTPAITGTKLRTLTPCRVIDTRNATGPLGGPILAAGQTRIFTVTGTCGIPTSAGAVVLNVTAVTPAAAGSFAIFPGDAAYPGTSTVAFGTGKTRASASINKLASDGSGTLAVRNNSTAAVDLVIDVAGYFTAVP